MSSTPSKSRRNLFIAGALILTLLIGLAGVWFVVITTLPVQCSQTLRYAWQPAFSAYRDGNADGLYPPMSTTPGNFFPDLESVRSLFPEDESAELTCLAGSPGSPPPSMEAQFAAPTYAYFGYALQNEEAMMAFLDAYPGFIKTGANFDEDLPAPAGKGSFGGDVFLRLRVDYPTAHGDAPYGMPVLFELPDYTATGLHFRHKHEKGSLLNFDSRVRFIRYGDSFPMTPAVIEKIGEIKAMYAAENAAVPPTPSE